MYCIVCVMYTPSIICVIRFGRNKILVYTEIRPVLSSTDSLMNDTGNFNLTNLPEDFRYTSLEHTILDMLISTHSHIFKGTPFSSVSDRVQVYKKSHPSFCCDEFPVLLCLASPDSQLLFRWERHYVWRYVTRCRVTRCICFTLFSHCTLPGPLLLDKVLRHGTI